MAQDTTPVRVLSPLPPTFVSRDLHGRDNNQAFISSTGQVATVNRNIGEGFGCTFKGPIAFATPADASGLSATVNDLRVTGVANPWCCIVCIARDVYDVIGGKS